MALENAMLFAPPQPPLQLDAEREVTLGRHAECDLPLQSREASRRHAAVRFREGQYWLRDLGSTNGTYLNGERVAEERALSPGDRIDIGDASVTFCRVDGAIAGMLSSPGEDAKTILAEIPMEPASEALHGDLALVPAFALVQMLEIGCRSGVLSIRREGDEAKMWLEEGRPVHAETEKQRGFEAAIELIQREQGRFEFGPGEDAPERTLDASLTELLLEATCRIDEARAEGSASEAEGAV